MTEGFTSECGEECKEYSLTQMFNYIWVMEFHRLRLFSEESSKGNYTNWANEFQKSDWIVAIYELQSSFSDGSIGLSTLANEIELVFDKYIIWFERIQSLSANEKDIVRSLRRNFNSLLSGEHEPASFIVNTINISRTSHEPPM